MIFSIIMKEKYPIAKRATELCCYKLWEEKFDVWGTFLQNGKEEGTGCLGFLSFQAKDFKPMFISFDNQSANLRLNDIMNSAYHFEVCFYDKGVIHELQIPKVESV